MYVWIARDNDGRLILHFNEPRISDISGLHWQSYPYTSMIELTGTPLEKIFDYLKPMDNPIKVKMKL